MLKRLSVVVALLIIALIVGGCTAGTTNAPPEAGSVGKRAISVIAALPVSQTVRRTLELPATVRANERVVVSARVQGYIKPYAHEAGASECAAPKDDAGDPIACRYQIGDSVEVGTLIATIETPLAAAQLEEIQAEEEAVKAQIDVARSEKKIKQLTFSRLKQVLDKDKRLMAQHRVDEARLEVQLATARFEYQRARLKALKARVSSLKQRLRLASVRAPFTGIVTRRYADSGALVGPGVDNGGGKGAILELIRKGDFKISIPVPEGESARIIPGKTAAVLDVPQAGIKGRPLIVSRIRRDIDVRSRTLTTELELKSDGAIMPGMLGRVRIVVEEREGLVVPATALIGKKGKVHLFVIERGQAVKRDITIGVDDGVTVEVLQGLSASDEVVIEAQNTLSNGVLVQKVKAD